MKRIGFLLLLVFLLIAMPACAKREDNRPNEQMNEEIPETEIEGLIEEQSFEVELDGWGKVTFASIAPVNPGGAPEFVLAKDNEIIYTFPGIDRADTFVQISAVSFEDYNEDGKKDVIVLAEYSNGVNTWNEPCIFLQENPDNMLYLNYPFLESYMRKGEAGEGPSFYRDTLLEEYLSKQRLTEKVSDITGTWADYVEYVDGLCGI